MGSANWSKAAIEDNYEATYFEDSSQDALAFKKYVDNIPVEALLPLNTDLNISHLISQESAGLQAVDMFCWGIARKYEQNDLSWYNLYQNKIRFETEYLR